MGPLPPPGHPPYRRVDDDTIACWGDSAGEFALPADAYAAVSASQGYLCAVTTAGTLVCDGGIRVGDTLWPGPPPEGSGFTTVETLLVDACALDGDGVVTCWGAADFTAYLPEEPLVQLSAGTSHACGITADRQHVRCWGVPSSWGG